TTSKTHPTTNQPAIGEFITKYEQLRDEGYTDVIGVFLSSGISGTYQTATQAGEMVEGINVHTFDSKISAMAMGIYVLRAIELIEQNDEPQAIIKELEAMREDTGARLMVEYMKNSYKTGAITAAYS